MSGHVYASRYAEDLAHSTAFPCHNTCEGDICYIDGHGGMTKREYIATAIMQGIHAGPLAHPGAPVEAFTRAAARQAVAAANALLEALAE